MNGGFIKQVWSLDKNPLRGFFCREILRKLPSLSGAAINAAAYLGKVSGCKLTYALFYSDKYINAVFRILYGVDL